MNISSIKNEVNITLSLFSFNKMDQYFPNDPYSDITIILDKKNYKLQKAYLRIESKYFFNSFEDDKEMNILIIGKKFDPNLFEKILRVFYGSKITIYFNEIYSAFEICNYLKTENLIVQFVDQLLQNFNNLNFFLLYQIGFIYNIEEILEKCYYYLKENQFKLILSEYNSISKPNNKYPSSLNSLSEDSFRNLILMHNKMRLSFLINKNAINDIENIFLSFIEIYNTIKNYAFNNYSKTEFTSKLKELVIELIDKNNLTAKEYKLIYHQDLFLNDEDRNFLNDFSYKESAYIPKKDNSVYLLGKLNENKYLDAISSENFLFKKEIEEMRNENTLLINELKILKENFTKSLDLIKIYDEKYNNLFNKFNDYKIQATAKEYQSNSRICNLEIKIDEISKEIFLNKKINENIANIQRAHSEKTYDIIESQKNNFENKSTQLLTFKGNNEKIEKNNNNQKNQNYIWKRSNVKNKDSLIAESVYISKKDEKFNLNNEIIEKKEEIDKKDTSFFPQNEITQDSFFIPDKNQPNINNESHIIPINYEFTHKNIFYFNNKSEIIKNEDQFELLKNWFNLKIYEKMRFSLLFKSTIDGFNAENFKKKLENISSLLSFFQLKNNEIIGFYTSNTLFDINQNENRCFIFSFNDKAIEENRKIINDSKNLITIENNLTIIDNCDSNPNNFFLINDENKIPLNNFLIQGIEVFQISIDSEMEL